MLNCEQKKAREVDITVFAFGSAPAGDVFGAIFEPGCDRSSPPDLPLRGMRSGQLPDLPGLKMNSLGSNLRRLFAAGCDRGSPPDLPPFGVVIGATAGSACVEKPESCGGDDQVSPG